MEFPTVVIPRRSPSTSRASTGALSAFHRFLDLPLELRVKIWEHFAKKSLIFFVSWEVARDQLRAEWRKRELITPMVWPSWMDAANGVRKIEERQPSSKLDVSPVLVVRGDADQLLHVSLSLHAEILPTLFRCAKYRVPDQRSIVYLPSPNMAALIEHFEISLKTLSACTMYRYLDQMPNLKKFVIDLQGPRTFADFILIHKHSEDEVKTELDKWSLTKSARGFAEKMLRVELSYRSIDKDDRDVCVRVQSQLSKLYRDHSSRGKALKISYDRQLPIGCPGDRSAELFRYELDYDDSCDEHGSFLHYAWVCSRCSESGL